MEKFHSVRLEDLLDKLGNCRRTLVILTMDVDPTFLPHICVTGRLYMNYW